MCSEVRGGSTPPPATAERMEGEKKKVTLTIAWRRDERAEGGREESESLFRSALV